MVVWDTGTVFINTASENYVGKLISIGSNITAPINKGMGMLCRYDRIEHNRKITAGRVFHSHRNVHSACSQPVLLILHRSCANGFIRQQIIQITPIFRIEHFIRRSQSAFRNGANMHFSDSDNPCQQIRCLIRLRLVQHAFVSFSGGTRFVGVDARNQQQLVRNLIIDFGKPIYIFADRIFIICRARAH